MFTNVLNRHESNVTFQGPTDSIGHILSLLEKVDALVNATPPEPGQQSRFGNRNFRVLIQKLEQVRSIHLHSIFQFKFIVGSALF
jgi:hypothetical protein